MFHSRGRGGEEEDEVTTLTDEQEGMKRKVQQIEEDKKSKVQEVEEAMKKEMEIQVQQVVERMDEKVQQPINEEMKEFCEKKGCEGCQ